MTAVSAMCGQLPLAIVLTLILFAPGGDEGVYGAIYGLLLVASTSVLGLLPAVFVFRRRRLSLIVAVVCQLLCAFMAFAVGATLLSFYDQEPGVLTSAVGVVAVIFLLTALAVVSLILALFKPAEPRRVS